MRFTCVLSLFCRVWVFETPMDCSTPGSSVHGILQARILEWVAIPSCRGSSWPRHHTCIFYVSCIGRWVFTTSTTWKALGSISPTLTANRGTKRWLPSRIGTLMGNEARWVTSPTRAPRPTREVTAPPGTTWQAAGQSERKSGPWAGCKQPYTPRQEASSHVTPWETGAGAGEGRPRGRWGALRLWRQGALGALTYPAHSVHKELNSQWRGWVERKKKGEVAKPRPRENQKVDITC